MAQDTGGDDGKDGGDGTITSCTVGWAIQRLRDTGVFDIKIQQALDKLGNPDENTIINIEETLEILANEESKSGEENSKDSQDSPLSGI